MRSLLIIALFALIAFSFAENCGENEEFRSCASKCEPTCTEKMPSCEMACGTAKCQCKDGFARHQGKCIDMERHSTSFILISVSPMGRFSLNGSRGFYSFQHDPLPSTLPTSPLPHRPYHSSSATFSCLSFRSKILSIVQLLLIACSTTVFTMRFISDDSTEYLYLCFTVLFPIPSVAIVWMIIKCEYSSGRVLSSRSRDCSMLLSLLSFAFLLTALLIFIHQDLSADKDKERPLLRSSLLRFNFSSLSLMYFYILFPSFSLQQSCLFNSSNEIDSSQSNEYYKIEY
uniref:TIL domain-containing protein n=1 Tax=Pristionchus pacificus TaxID=54126 RepID=A0A2A6CIQ9_PRIPA|eukprot:PDM78105.1 hypothetical protein PRIPAC_30490 [Pristionchus pacificus]